MGGRDTHGRMVGTHAARPGVGGTVIRGGWRGDVEVGGAAIWEG